MSVTQQRTNYPNWMSLQGTTLDGVYLIGQCLGADERSVTFKTRVKGDQPAKAVVKIYRADSDAAGEQIALWEEIKQITHPNLTAIFGSGRTTLQGNQLIYVVTEAADETLASVLEERALDTAEAGELLLGIRAALEHLHSNGFVHGTLCPEQVFAVGDAIKLSTEGARRSGSKGAIELNEAKYCAPESTGGNLTPESDLWCFGATLFEALTQKDCSAGCAEQGSELAEPFGTIVHRCLYANPETRCTPAEMLQIYHGKQRAFAAAAGASAAPGLGVVEGGRSRARVLMPEKVPSGTVSATPRQESGRIYWPGEAQKSAWRLWVPIVVISVLVIAGVIWLAMPKQPAQPGPTVNQTSAAKRATPAQQAQAPVSQPNPSAAERNGATAQVPPVNSATSRKNVDSRAAAREPGSKGTQYVNGPVWRVVVYTYNRRPDAESSARAINAKHADLNAQVFSPTGGSPYLVVIGSKMDRDDAASLRDKALRLGLPRDSYIQNYKQ